jgi:hypothetical protein
LLPVLILAFVLVLVHSLFDFFLRFWIIFRHDYYPPMRLPPSGEVSGSPSDYLTIAVAVLTAKPLGLQRLVGGAFLAGPAGPRPIIFEVAATHATAFACDSALLARIH